MEFRQVRLPWFAVRDVLLLAAAMLHAPSARADEGGSGSQWPIVAYGDVRLVGVNGEPAWDQGAFGKLRFGGNGTSGADWRVRPELGEAGIVWRPRLGWAWSATIAALVEGGDRSDAGLSEAYVSFRPLSARALRFQARAGLMWPAISLEHAGPEWRVADTITPSAINSWIGEEIKPVAIEATARLAVGAQTLSLTGAAFEINDTAGALLAFRGWALHDRKVLAFRKQPLPALNAFLQTVQPGWTHPVLNVDADSRSRPGWYAALAWDMPGKLQLQAFHYDNRSDPEDVDDALEWGWHTRFSEVGLRAQLTPALEFRAQGLAGHSEMGFAMPQVRWIDTRYRAAYAMVTRRFALGSASIRLDAFGTRNHGSALEADNDEDGWALTAATRREFGRHVSVLAEYLHVDSTRDSRALTQTLPHQAQDQVQVVVRGRL